MTHHLDPHDFARFRHHRYRVHAQCRAGWSTPRCSMLGASCCDCVLCLCCDCVLCPHRAARCFVLTRGGCAVTVCCVCVLCLWLDRCFVLTGCDCDCAVTVCCVCTVTVCRAGWSTSRCSIIGADWRGQIAARLRWHPAHTLSQNTALRGANDRIVALEFTACGTVFLAWA